MCVADALHSAGFLLHAALSEGQGQHWWTPLRGQEEGGREARLGRQIRVERKGCPCLGAESWGVYDLAVHTHRECAATQSWAFTQVFGCDLVSRNALP